MKILKIMASDVINSFWFGLMALIACFAIAGFVAGAMAGQVAAILAGVPLPWWVNAAATAGWLVVLCMWRLSAKERDQ